MSLRGVVIGAVIGLVGASAIVGVSAGILTGSSELSVATTTLGYRPVPHCVVVDTRQAGGSFVAATSRTYDVTPENGDFSNQGGSSTGCGVPEGADAVFFNLKTEHVSGQGRVEVYAAGESSNGAPVVNFDASSFKDNAGSTTRLCQGSCFAGDFVVNVPGQIGASTHVIVTVVGYFDDISDRTVVVRGSGTPTANGQALDDAVDAVRAMNPTPSDPWLIKLEPGIYDLGTLTILLSGSGEAVSLEGAGRDATIIETAKNNSTGELMVARGPGEISRLTLHATGGSRALLIGSEVRVTDAALKATGGATALFVSDDDSAMLDNVEVISTNGTSIDDGIYVSNDAELELANSTVTAHGGYGIYVQGATATIRGSSIRTTDPNTVADGIKITGDTSQATVVDSDIHARGDDGIETDGTTVIRRSTVHTEGNAGDGGSGADGVWIDPSGVVTISHSVISSDGDDAVANQGSLTATHSMFDAPDPYQDVIGASADCYATTYTGVGFYTTGCP